VFLLLQGAFSILSTVWRDDLIPDESGLASKDGTGEHSLAVGM